MYDIEIKYLRSSLITTMVQMVVLSRGQSDVVPNSNNFCYFQYNHLFIKKKTPFVNKIALQLEE